MTSDLLFTVEAFRIMTVLIAGAADSAAKLAGQLTPAALEAQLQELIASQCVERDASGALRVTQRGRELYGKQVEELGRRSAERE
jgi:predicted transcriptional regulator